MGKGVLLWGAILSIFIIVMGIVTSPSVLQEMNTALEGWSVQVINGETFRDYYRLRVQEMEPTRVRFYREKGTGLCFAEERSSKRFLTYVECEQVAHKIATE